MIETILFILLIVGRKRGKKGWMKIFEASIAITLVMGFMVLVYSQTIERPPAGENLVKWQTSVLDELKNRPNLREEILSSPTTVCDPNQGGLVYGFIFERITKAFPGFGFSCRVCDPGEICGIQQYKKEVYSEEKIIAATLTQFSPKKLKLFVWPLEPDENVTPIACTPNWQCTDWSQCENGKQTRTCTDTKNCAKPPTRTETQDCAAADTTPPGSISGLFCGITGQNAPYNWPIQCKWTNPTDPDFNEILIYVNGALLVRLAKTNTAHTFSEIPVPTPADGTSKSYRIVIHTNDTSGNENKQDVSKTCVSTTAGEPRRYTCS